MRILFFIATGAMLWQAAGSAQASDTSTSLAQTSGVGFEATGVVGVLGTSGLEYAPLTASERLRRYLKGAFGPGAILKAAAEGGISQATNTPKEWRGGAEAYGDRVGNAYARHVIEATLENGAAALLREDDRYFRSIDSGFWMRTKHAVGSAFVARNNAGGEHFAYSRIGGVAGSAFISRIWQPHSTNTAGDGAVSFGLGMATKIGWNVFKEFRSARFQ